LHRKPRHKKKKLDRITKENRLNEDLAGAQHMHMSAIGIDRKNPFETRSLESRFQLVALAVVLKVPHDCGARSFRFYRCLV
jgi:hypothetical protein